MLFPLANVYHLALSRRSILKTYSVRLHSRDANREVNSGNPVSKLLHPPPLKKKAMRPPPNQIANPPPCPQVELELPMFTLTLQWEKRKIFEVFQGPPKVEFKSSKDFPMLALRIRKVSEVHQSILKTNRFLIYNVIWLWKRRKHLPSFLQHVVLWLK